MMVVHTVHRKNIVLIGLSGTGKSTVAQYISQKTGRLLIDTDALVEQETGQTIADLFSGFGEHYFRQVEEGLIRKISSSRNAVIACGGGVVLNQSNIRLLASNGVLFCLVADLSERRHRLSKSEVRPLLEKDTYQQMLKQQNERMHLYKIAEYQIDTNNKSISEIGDEIIRIMETTKV